VEEGRAATPVRERYKFNPVYGFIQSGFILWPLTGSKRFNGYIEDSSQWLVTGLFTTDYYYLHLSPTVSTPFLWGFLLHIVTINFQISVVYYLK